MRIKISIIGGDRIFSEGMAFLINRSENTQCVSTHTTAEEALKRISTLQPNVILMDLPLPQISVIDSLQKLKLVLPRVRIIMLSSHEDSDSVFNSISAGASGYLERHTSAAKILEAIEEVSNGGSPMSGRIVRMMVEHFQGIKHSTSELKNLSKREQGVLELLAKGYRYKEIADHLGIRFDTVRSHLRSVYDKLHVHSRTEAVVKYLRASKSNS
jgi:DNA-binding NarL/FixJ family response regulator